MKAIRFPEPGGPEVLQLAEVPDPAPSAGEVLIRVRACGVNPADTLQRKGRYPAPPGWPQEIPGLEFAGEIAALGPRLRGAWSVGDRVMGLVGGGAYAEYVAVAEEMLLPIPEKLSFAEAGAVPEAFITAHDALVTQGGLTMGERVLIHAAAGGVGVAAVQIAHAMGCETFGTSRTAAKLESLRGLGLDHGIDTATNDFAKAVEELTAGQGVHLVIDTLGQPAWAGNMRALAMRGRMVMLGFLAGAEGSVNLRHLLAKRLTVRGTTLRVRPREESFAATAAMRRAVMPLLERGTLRPVVDKVFPLAEAAAAHRRVESGESFGRVVLAVDS